jgi:hypothetical protein
MTEALTELIQTCMIALQGELDADCEENITKVETIITGNMSTVLAIITTDVRERRFHIEVKELTQ